MTTDNIKIQTDLNAIIDAACTKTVAGEEWLHNYIKNLDDTLINQVKVYSSKEFLNSGTVIKLQRFHLLKYQPKLVKLIVL